MNTINSFDLSEKIEKEALRDLTPVAIKRCIVNKHNIPATTGNQIRITEGNIYGPYTIHAITDTTLVLDEQHVPLTDVLDFELDKQKEIPKEPGIYGEQGNTLLKFSILEGLATVSQEKAISELLRTLHGDEMYKVIIPDHIEDAIEGAFKCWPVLEYVRLPIAMHVLPKEMFMECYNLTHVGLPEKLWRIESRVFKKCLSLHKIHLPSTLDTICEGAFEGSGLQHISLPDGLTTIEERAFRDCSLLQSVDYKGVTYTSRSRLEVALYSNNVCVSGTVFEHTDLQD